MCMKGGVHVHVRIGGGALMYGMVWYGMVCVHVRMVWYGTVWYGMVCVHLRIGGGGANEGALAVSGSGSAASPSSAASSAASGSAVSRTTTLTATRRHFCMYLRIAPRLVESQAPNGATATHREEPGSTGR